MYVTYYFVLGKVPWRSPCIQSLHFIDKELKPRAMTLLRSQNYMVEKLGPEAIFLFLLLIIMTIIIFSIFPHN